MSTRRLQAMMLLALLGVLVVMGLLAWALLGPVGGAAYAVVVAAVLVVGARRARAAATPSPEPGRTCTCCTTTVHDPIEVRP